MASTEPKSNSIDEETRYSVTEDDDEEQSESENDQFSQIKPKLLKTPSILNEIIDQIHPEIIAKFVVLKSDVNIVRCCFLRSHQSNFVVFPPKLDGCVVVDLGCGVGRDVFILSKLVGKNGRVIGIDSEKDQVKRRKKIELLLEKIFMNFSWISLENSSIIIEKSLNYKRQMSNLFMVKSMNSKKHR